MSVSYKLLDCQGAIGIKLSFVISFKAKKLLNKAQLITKKIAPNCLGLHSTSKKVRFLT